MKASSFHIIAAIALGMAGCDSEQGTLAPQGLDGTTADGERPLDGAEARKIPAPPASMGLDLDARIRAAEQVLHGTVVALDYAHSEDQGEATLSFPHTFVTLRVDTPIKGGTRGDQVTLRFAGGVVEPGLVMTSAHIPLLDVGHEVVLFVADNGESACPLVGCQEGLARISDGRVYDQGGAELFLDAEHVLRAGPVQDVPEANIFHIGGERVELNADAWDEDLLIESPGAVAREPFLVWLQERVEAIEDPALLASLPSVPRLDPAAPFVIARPDEPVRPLPRRADRLQVQEPLSPADREEREALRASGGDPVLSR